MDQENSYAIVNQRLTQTITLLSEYGFKVNTAKTAALTLSRPIFASEGSLEQVNITDWHEIWVLWYKTISSSPGTSIPSLLLGDHFVGIPRPQ
ncbi:hypothetical protein Ciccas_013202 [Cichlidogyrus casuarinus]|uniref:Reverse transcriptase domain-containing protein n=1 Tax=Cichlidogyrus casuarinus TaxID=1844966 RepID=A0ABD2PMN6_9PLAT